jgi:hypothetical protein
MEFENLWSKLKSKLRPRTIIPNWTADGGYFGGTITIVELSNDAVEVELSTAKNHQLVGKSDFEEVWQIWESYNAGKFKRGQITPLTRNSKYVISILHWMESL